MDSAKKDAILAEAAKAFARWGFRKTSVDDVARAAGVAKGTIYLASSSKEDLFFQAVEREVRAWLVQVGALVDPTAPADELLARMSQAGMAYMESHPLVRDLLFGRTGELLPALQARLEELRVLGASYVVEVLKLGVAQGIFRAELDCVEVASLLQDLQLTAYVFHRGGPEFDARLARRWTAGLDLVMNGLRRRPA